MPVSKPSAARGCLKWAAIVCGIAFGTIVLLLAVLMWVGAHSTAVGRPVITDRVDASTQQPLLELYQVPAGEQSIYATVQVTTGREAIVVAKWYLDDVYTAKADAPYKARAGYHGWVSFQLSAPAALPRGHYRVEIYANGKKKSEKEFNVA